MSKIEGGGILVHFSFILFGIRVVKATYISLGHVPDSRFYTLTGMTNVWPMKMGEVTFNLYDN